MLFLAKLGDVLDKGQTLDISAELALSTLRGTPVSSVALATSSLGSGGLALSQRQPKD